MDVKKRRKNRVLYITDYCLTPHEHIDHSAILCDKNRIISVGGASAFKREEGLKVVELKGCYAVPGFIDSHIHGAGGFDSNDLANPHEMLNIKYMCKTLASHGVTSFIPTLISDHIDSIFTAFENFSNLREDNFFQFGAEPVGLHIEGPFINIKKRGSQPAAGIIPIDLGLVKELIAAAKGQLKIWTFAPELELSIPFIELLCENNIVPSMGHSNANELEVLAAVDAGARRCTHLFNGMAPFHQRNISLTSVALTDDRISVELILDGKHLHPRIVDLTCRAKPKNRIIGVSDAIQGAGLNNDGQYHLGRSGIHVKDGLAKTSDGILSGTTLTLETGWHHLITYSNLEHTAAAACFTTNPANDLGLYNYGEIIPGKVANISFFDKETNRARLTICQGKVVYDSTL